MGQATMNFGPWKMAVQSLGPVKLIEALHHEGKDLASDSFLLFSLTK